MTNINNQKLYRVYKHMKDRCYNKNDPHYKYYVTRGIKICEAWRKDYNVFKMWAIDNGYKEGLSIDRIDVNGDYSPDNCRWITMKQQQRNNRYITYKGETHYLAEWAEILNINKSTLSTRLQRDWPIEQVLEMEKRHHD